MVAVPASRLAMRLYCNIDIIKYSLIFLFVNRLPQNRTHTAFQRAIINNFMKSAIENTDAKPANQSAKNQIHFCTHLFN